MKKIIIALIVVSTIILFSTVSNNDSTPKQWNAESDLFEVLHSFGEPVPKHKKQFTDEQIRLGKEIVYEGRAKKANGKFSKRVSKYYECTTCHNQEQEDPD